MLLWRRLIVRQYERGDKRKWWLNEEEVDGTRQLFIPGAISA